MSISNKFNNGLGIAKNKHCSPLRWTKAIVVDLNVYKEEER